MKIVVTFQTDNAAFEDGGLNEYGYVMTQVYEKIYNSEIGKHSLLDSNGNTVGNVKISLTGKEVTR